MKSNIVICGAGLAGVSAAYFLSVREGISDILLVDERPPLSLTSDHSTECYRNWWPDRPMVQLVDRSIDLLEELAEISGNVFQMNRRGYLYCCGEPEEVETFCRTAEATAQLSSSALRLHQGRTGEPDYQPAEREGFRDAPIGADLLLDKALIHRNFPFLSEKVEAALHVRRAGWLSAQQLGMYLLDQARRHGVKLVESKVSGIDLQAGRVSGVRLQNGTTVQTRTFVNAAGPFLREVGQMLGIELPVYNELHLKLAMRDSLGVLDRSAPLVIWSDPQKLDWSAEEADYLAEDPKNDFLLGQLPAGVHARPEGGSGSQMILVLWEYQTRLSEPIYPIAEDPLYPEVVLRGLARLIPGMRGYIARLPQPRVDGGYYTRTRENRPLIGKLPVEGAYVIGALSGFGMMTACAAGELLARHVAGIELPNYSPAFALERYADPKYLAFLEQIGETGQL